VIFGMGGFVIVAAIIRAIYCLVPSLISYVYMNWYFREASVAIYVTTLPGIWVFLKEMFPIIQKLTSRTPTRPTNSQTADMQKSNPGWRQPTKNNRSMFDSKNDLDFDLDTYPISKSMVTTNEHDLGTHAHSSSDHGQGDADSASSVRYEAVINGIRCDKTFTVESIPRAHP